MASLNKVILMGNLGQKPEIRYTATQVPVVNFSVATSEYKKDQSGNPGEETSWHRVVVWNQQAENCNKYLDKGSKVLIEGRIQYSTWTDQQGNKRYSTEILAQRVQFLGSRPDNAGTGNYAGSPAAQPPSGYTPTGSEFPDPSGAPPAFPKNDGKKEDGGKSEFPDLNDIPF